MQQHKNDQKTSLTWMLRIGDELSFDNGRIVIRLEEQSGSRRAYLNLRMDPRVRVDKPPK